VLLGGLLRGWLLRDLLRRGWFLGWRFLGGRFLGGWFLGGWFLGELLLGRRLLWALRPGCRPGSELPRGGFGSRLLARVGNRQAVGLRARGAVGTAAGALFTRALAFLGGAFVGLP
jgi:hypothetical protein